VIGQSYPDEENRGKRREMIKMLFYSKSKEAEKTSSSSPYPQSWV